MSRGLRQICERVYRRWGGHALLKAYIYLDLFTGTFMLIYPALFAELVYPQLTPHGVILAIKLLGAWRLGRGGALLITPPPKRRDIAPWLALSSAPLHTLALWGFGGGWLSLGDAISATWHGVHLTLSLSVIWSGRRTRSISL